MTTIDLTSICSAAVALFAACLTGLAIPWLREKSSAKQLEKMLRWVDIAVRAAEQLYAHSSGSIRKKYVLEFLERKGYRVDTEEVDNAIEAAVQSLKKELST